MSPMKHSTSLTNVDISTSSAPEPPCQWEDVTMLFRSATASMSIGEMIHSKSFSLYGAMSAIELMDPKMDVGGRALKNVNAIAIPSTLSDQQVINIMDHLLECEMSWLDAHTLPQTVFSCVYAQRMTEIPRLELFNFLKIQMATMNLIVDHIMDERIAEEDFVFWNYGFRLRPLQLGRRSGDDDILSSILDDTEDLLNQHRDQPGALAHGIMLRIKFRVQFYRALSYLLNPPKGALGAEAVSLMSELYKTAVEWERCSSSRDVDQELMDRIFDESINHHLMTCTPPRTAPLLQAQAAFKYLHALIIEMKAIVDLRHMALPRALNCTDVGKEKDDRFSMQVAVHAIQSFCAEHEPKVFSRCLLFKLMFPRSASALFQAPGAEVLRLVSTDMGSAEAPAIWEGFDHNRILDGVSRLLECLCHNRSRQRRQILHVVQFWDQFSENSSFRATCGQANGSVSVSHMLGENPSRDAENSTREVRSSLDSRRSLVETQIEKAAIKNPLESLLYQTSTRLLVHHLLLGFALDLYQRYEYAAVFFYVDYALSAMARAIPLAAMDSKVKGSSCPLRCALFVMDEARQWLCRALFSTLEALSMGQQWDYSSVRARKQADSALQMFGSEELWYEQRFGVMRRIRSGPVYADYASFIEFRRMRDKYLRSVQPGVDPVVAHLKEAASEFMAARRKAEKAKRATGRHERSPVIDEILKIARVAIENSLSVSNILRSYESQSSAQCRSTYSVKFNFDRHNHFPIIEVTKQV